MLCVILKWNFEMKRYVTLEPNQAGIIQNNYGCAWCWNGVRVCHDKSGDYITCGTEDCRCSGLVSLKWIERQVEEQEARSKIARRVLQNSFEWIKIVRKQEYLTSEELIKQLGF
jgi:hypothetical protein